MSKVKKQRQIIIISNDLEMNLSSWSKYLGISYDTLRLRYRRGWRGDDLLRKPRPYKKSNS